jgi:hypothetical protein
LFVFVDHATGHVHVKHQVHLTSHETLQAKERYEDMCRDHGILVQSYLSDNANAFTSQEYTSKLSVFKEVMRFAGVGAHHHNGVAERSIGSIMAMARTMMLHAAIHWPDSADATLWPMAVLHAVFLYNHVPNETTGISPNDLFTKTRWAQSKLHDIHVWGCPVYVLDSTIADGKKIPKWKPRSERAIYMGLSPKHTSQVPLVLNQRTGSITPQYHVVFDDWFATVSSDEASLPDFNSPEWARTFGESEFQFPFDEEDLEDMPELEGPPPSLLPAIREADLEDAFELHRPATQLPVLPRPTEKFPSPMIKSPAPAEPLSHASTPESPNVSPIELPSPRQVNFDVPTPQHLLKSPPSYSLSSPREPHVSTWREPLRVSPRREPTTTPFAQREIARSPQKSALEHVAASPKLKPAPIAATVPPPARRSTRTRVAPVRFGYDGNQAFGYSAFEGLFTESYILEISVFAASSSDPDTLGWDDAMAEPEPHRSKWMEAAQIEISALESKHCWEEVPATEATTKILPGTWVFRRKRSPDGEVKKYKGRYCCRGDLEETNDETFAPVVAWSTARFFLVLSISLGWHTCSVDFSNAFVQATLNKKVWIHLPRGFASSQGRKTCLRLKKSLYGLSIAPRLWFQHLMLEMKRLGFVQSVHDPCLLFKSGMMIVLFVYDGGIAAENPEDVEKVVSDLRSHAFELTQEGSFSEFLGIKFEYSNDRKTITMTQKGLIQKIIKASKMEDCNPNWTPASTQALGIDPDGEPIDEEWNYRSIVGMMLYLSTNTCPDIAFAVSQVARFSHNPKKSHATGVKMIVLLFGSHLRQGHHCHSDRNLGNGHLL